jgi:glutamate formiminotransferase
MNSTLELAMRTLVECVPNFSEGRDPGKVDAIVEAIRSVGGVYILDKEMDADHNRSVITFVASREKVAEAAIRGVARAVELIDLTRHTGAHPRIGAADVVPFVPVEGVTLDDCVSIARQAGEQIWQRLGVPVYLYEAAASRPERRNLEKIRKGQFEGLRDEIAASEERRPDFGEPHVHPTAGATVVGARKFLIAYNINLNTADVEVAKKIAKTIRASSGGFPAVKAMGVALAARNLAQVSMNLTDFEQTSIYTVWEAVKAEAARYGAEPIGSEIIGLVPKKALEMVAASFLKVENFSPEMILENRLAAALEQGGPESASVQCQGFLDAVAAPTATPGGGSVSALAGALAAALGQMVAGLSRKKKAYAQQEPELSRLCERLAKLGEELKQAMDRDAQSYEGVLAAYRLPKESPGREEAIQQALRGAAEVPLGVAERAAEVGALLARLSPLSSPQMASDLKVGALLAEAAIEGARANVEINLESISDASWVAAVRGRLPA